MRRMLLSTCSTSSWVVHGFTASRPRMAYEVVVIGRGVDMTLPLGESLISQRESIRRFAVTPTNAVQIAASNTEQLHAWDGDEGAYWAARADYFDRSALPYHRRLLASAAIDDGDRVLDIGCGTGQTTLLAAQAAMSGSALGVDLSSPMLAYARRRATDEGIDNASFEQADAQIHSFEAAAFDVAISNTGATFFGDLVAGFKNVGRALRPSGRVALLTWQSFPNNEWVREFTGALAGGRDVPAPPPDAPSPFALSDPDRVRGVLTKAG